LNVSSFTSNIGQSLSSCRWKTASYLVFSQACVVANIYACLAPEIVEFYNTDWTEIGTKSSLRVALHEITGINMRVLEGESPSVCNVAYRLSWASRRRTTRVEDMAYSLLGLFDINMPLLYGEGINAFRRLQEEILKNLKDYTLFAWRDHDGLPSGDGILAPSAANFCRPDNCVECSGSSAWMYKDLLTRQFSDVKADRSWQSNAQMPEEPHMLTSSADLPTFMGGRLRMNLPVAQLADPHSIDAQSEPSPGKTVLAYIGYRNGRNENLLCLQLGPDWEDNNDFCRNGLVQVPKTKISHFSTKTIILVSWRNMTTRPETALRDALRYEFCLGPLPPCLSVLHEPFPPSDEAATDDSSSFIRQLYTNFHDKDRLILHKKTWAISVLQHKHRGTQATEEYVEVRFGPVFNTPVCSATIRGLHDRARLQAKWAAEGLDARFGTDRVKVLGCSGSHAVSVSVKRQPNLKSSMPNFLVRIGCEAIVATGGISQRVNNS
jgi:hypothetical protein